MPGIVINSNFDLNQGVPIDSRLVATSSAVRNNILYKYDGLKVYQTDDKKTYLWNGTSWNVEGSGIYGGSGSLLGDTVVSFGTVSSTVGSDSLELAFGTDYTSTKSRMVNRFLRHSTAVVNQEYTGVEYRQQLTYFNNQGIQRNSSYIGFNSYSPLNAVGDLTFNTGDNTVKEGMRITNKGYVGIGTDSPREQFQIGNFPESQSLHNSFKGQSLPITIHKGQFAVIGYNWYSDDRDQVFDLVKGSSKIVQSNGEIAFYNRNAGIDEFSLSAYLSDKGDVGIKTSTPQYSLDVNGSFKSSSAVITGNVTAPNFFANNYNFSNSQFKITGTTNSLDFNKGNTNYIRIDTMTQSNQRIIINSSLITGTTSVTGNLDATGNITSTVGRITNFEDPSILTPFSTVYWSKNGIFKGNVSDGGTYTLNSFTYSFNFYRVGALVQLDFMIKYNGSLNYGTENFYGWLLRFDDARFKPTSYSVGSGVGGFQGSSIKAPILPLVFTGDGTVNNPSITGNQFFLKIQTFMTTNDATYTTKQGGDFIGSTTYLAFKGTVTYIASSNIANVINLNDPNVYLLQPE